MSEKRIIKKYPNRRLYDTAISSYITLEDVRKLLLDNVSVSVFEAKSGEDITHVTLMQIVSEQETKMRIFSTDVLEKIIQAHDGAKGQLLKQYMDQGLKVFADKAKALPKDLDAVNDSHRKSTADATKEWINSFSQVAYIPPVTEATEEKLYSVAQ